MQGGLLDSNSPPGMGGKAFLGEAGMGCGCVTGVWFTGEWRELSLEGAKGCVNQTRGSNFNGQHGPK